MSMETIAEMSSFILPSGDDLRVFLGQETLTAAMLRKVLRMRGIYVSNNDKREMLDHILLSFLTPDEFTFLLDEVKTKEDSRKFRSRSYTVSPSATSLAEMLPQEIDFHKVVRDDYGNWRPLGTPALTRESADGKHSYVLSYDVERTNIGSDWIRARRVFPAEVRYTFNPATSKIDVTAIHTSVETEHANKMITAHIKRELKKANVLANDLEDQVIFNSFENAQRLLFLMQFTGFNEGNGIVFDRLTDIALKLDPKLKPPTEERLSWANSVDKVLLNGEALQDTFFVKDKTCWPYLLVWKMEAKFHFSTAEFSGSFTAVFEFADYATNKLGSAEFQISLPTLSGKGIPAHGADASALTKQFTLRLNEAKAGFLDAALSYNPPPVAQ